MSSSVPSAALEAPRGGTDNLLRKCHHKLALFLAMDPPPTPSRELVEAAEHLIKCLDQTSSVPSGFPGGPESVGLQAIEHRKEISHLLISNPGLETITAREAASVSGAKLILPAPFGCAGYVAVGGVPDASTLLDLRSVHDVLEFHGHFVIGQKQNHGQVPATNGSELLQEICTQVKGMDLSSVLSMETKSFRVRSERSGHMGEVKAKSYEQSEGGKRKRDENEDPEKEKELRFNQRSHGFKSNEVEREVGGVLHEKYKIQADMKGFETCIRVDIVMDQVLVGSMPNRDLLSKRHKIAFVRSVTLKPNVAYCMIRLSGLQRGGSLLDPFCGGGTIPMEAACIFGSNGKFLGADKSETVVKGAQANAEASGLAEAAKFQILNARALERVFDAGSFDVVVTNPPWGVRVGKDAELEKIYKGFLYSCAKVMKLGGRLVFIVQRCEMVLEIIRKTGHFQVLEMCAVKTGDLVPTIFVLENLGRDGVRESLKRQVRKLTPLISITKANHSKPEEVLNEEDSVREEIVVEADPP